MSRYNTNLDEDNDILLAKIVSKSFLDQDLLKPLKKSLIDILKIANQNYIHKKDRIKLKEIISAISEFFVDGLKNKKRCHEDQDEDDESKHRKFFKSFCDFVSDARIRIKKLPPTMTDVQDDSDQEMLVPDDYMSAGDDSDLEDDNSQTDNSQRYRYPVYRCPEISCRFHEKGMSSKHLRSHVGKVHPEIDYDINELERIWREEETAAEDQRRKRTLKNTKPYEVVIIKHKMQIKDHNCRDWLRCPEVSCKIHETGMESNNLSNHIKRVHPHIVYNRKELEVIDTPLEYNLNDSSEGEDVDGPIVEPGETETIEVQANKYIKKGFEADDVKKFFASALFSEECPSCNQTFTSAITLAYHSPCVPMTKVGPLLQCPMCNETRSHSDAIKIHLDKKHLKIPKFECKECCHKTLTAEDSLQHLIDNHSAENQFRCSFNRCLLLSGFSDEESCRNHIMSEHLGFDLTEYCQMDSGSELLPEEITGAALLDDVPFDRSFGKPRDPNVSKWSNRGWNRYRCPDESCLYHKLGLRVCHIKDHIMAKHPEIEYDISKFQRLPKEDPTVQSYPIIPVFYRKAGISFYRCPERTCKNHLRGLKLLYLRKHVIEAHPTLNYRILNTDPVVPQVAGTDGQSTSDPPLTETKMPIKRKLLYYKCPVVNCQFHKTGMKSYHLRHHLATKHPYIEYNLDEFEKIPTAEAMARAQKAIPHDYAIIPKLFRKGKNAYYACPAKSCPSGKRPFKLELLRKHIKEAHPGETYQLTNNDLKSNQPKSDPKNDSMQDDPTNGHEIMSFFNDEDNNATEAIDQEFDDDPKSSGCHENPSNQTASEGNN